VHTFSADVTVSMVVFPDVPAAVEEWWLGGVSVQIVDPAGSIVPSLRIVGDFEAEFDTDQTNIAAHRVDVWIDQMRFQWDQSNALYTYWETDAGQGNVRYAPFPSESVRRTVKATRVKSSGLATTYIDGVEVASNVVDAGGALTPLGLGIRMGGDSDGRLIEADVYSLVLRDGIDGPVVARFDAQDVP